MQIKRKVLKNSDFCKIWLKTRKTSTNFGCTFEIWAVQRGAYLVDLEKCCKMIIYLQRSVPIQKRTSFQKFDHFAEESERKFRYRIFALCAAVGHISKYLPSATVCLHSGHRGACSHPCFEKASSSLLIAFIQAEELLEVVTSSISHVDLWVGFSISMLVFPFWFCRGPMHQKISKYQRHLRLKLRKWSACNYRMEPDPVQCIQ